jgi:hypothetical protein
VVHFEISLTKKTSLIFILSFTAIAIIDSTIVKLFSYSGVELPPSSNMVIFGLFSIVFALIGFMLLKSVKELRSKTVYRLPSRMKYLHFLIIAVQTLMIGILISLILQMALWNKYNIIILKASTYLTHISALVFLIFLVLVFIGWLKSRRNYIILLYTIAFSLISVTILISLIHLEYNFSRTLTPDRKPFPINSYIIRQETTSVIETLGTAFDILSLSSFFAIWIATMALLSQYRNKLGRIKFFTLITIPLIYYMFPLQAYFGNVFSPIVLNSPVTFGIFYVLIFSATKQAGAFLFSLAFWTASTLVTKERVRKSLLVSAVGMAILYGSIEIGTLQYRPTLWTNNRSIHAIRFIFIIHWYFCFCNRCI